MRRLRCIVLCALSVVIIPARADIVETAKGFLFRGNLRPGEFPTEVFIDGRAFADQAESSCSRVDFQIGICRTQYRQESDPIDPFSVDDAITGFSKKTSWVAQDDVVLRFSDLLPVNGEGADFALLQGFTQVPFSIKVRTLDGTEYPNHDPLPDPPPPVPGYEQVPEAPFIQITQPPFDENGESWGPCPLDRDIALCGPFPNFRSQILLMYRIDFDSLGVPAGTTIAEVVIRPAAGRVQTPHIVMAAALNSFEVVPSVSDHIRNGRFAEGSTHWTAVGGGTVDIVPGEPAHFATTPDQPVALTQIIDTPNQSFQIVFDRKFLTPAGTLVVSIDGTTISETTPSVSPDPITRETIYINDVTLMGLQDVELRIELQPGSIAELLLYGIGITQWAGPADSVVADVAVEHDYVDPVSGQLVQAEDSDGSKLSPGERVEAATEALLSEFERLSVSAFAARSVLVDEISFGLRATVFDNAACADGACGDNLADFPKAIAGGTGNNVREIVVIYMLEADPEAEIPPSGLVDLGWVMNVGGSLESSSRECVASIDVEMSFQAEYVAEQVIWEGKAALFGEGSGAPAVLSLNPFGDRDPSVPSWQQNDWLEVAPQFGDGTNFFIDHRVDLSGVAHLPVDATANLILKFRGSVGSSLQEGDPCYGVVEFLDTFEVTPVTGVPGTRLVAPDDGANQPPVADAGPDVAVAADSVCLATVTLDGSGSSDPDGDALGYSWTGPFGTAGGQFASVSLPLGDHIVSLTVEDGHGSSATDEVVIAVEDHSPPVIDSISAAPGVLWPPNHKMVPIDTSVNASDNCGVPTVELVSVSMNEGDEANTFDGIYDSTPGDGHTVGDIEVDGAGIISLRAERAGTGNGRVYMIEYAAIDEAGNSTTVTTDVVVPHD